MKLQIVKSDPYLAPFQDQLLARLNYYNIRLDEVKKLSGSLRNFATGHLYFGIHPKIENDHITGIYYREWAPEADALYLIGDFNNWDRNTHPLKKINHDTWEIFLPYPEYQDRFTHLTKYKVRVVSRLGDQDRIPLYAHRVIQNESTKDFTTEYYAPITPYLWKTNNHKLVEAPIIYEAHIGMAQEKLGVGSFKDFQDNVLPRVKAGGYNTIQLMGIMEHPYYGSFGYHVSNFFALSSRFGTPDEFKELVDCAHAMGISVIIDLVHSHSVKNQREGICEFDGTVHQFFHNGPKGDHIAWDSKVFDYQKLSVVHFLLSNINYWLTEYRLDGFRMDGITSMLYHHHGLGVNFTSYHDYFTNVDGDALCYLQLANTLIKEINPSAISIAEDMSGMPGLCRPITHGGIGFDYRLSMGVPDYWIKTLKAKRDEDWDMFELYGMLENRRKDEPHIAYAESHDQAIVGDKTIAMWLMNDHLYHSMNKSSQNHVIDRGIALHKMIRLITLSLGGEGYLNFIGNEFGHPEWIDFPREGNNWSYWYARRQWSLVDNKELRYHHLLDFDREMITLIRREKLLSIPPRQLHIDPVGKLIFFEKGDYLFCFNFNPHHSFPNYQVGVPRGGEYRVALNSDSRLFGGHDRIDETLPYKTTKNEMNHHADSLFLYLPTRTALLLRKVK